MVLRHRKKGRHKYMGSRKWGRGNIKKGRGKGSRGGKGFAGSSKHKWVWVITHHPEHFGKESMKSLKKEDMQTVNLWALNKMAAEGKFEKSGDGKYIVNLAGFKVLGSGKPAFPFSVTADAFSKSAVEKIKGAGGDAKISSEE